MRARRAVLEFNQTLKSAKILFNTIFRIKFHFLEFSSINADLLFFVKGVGRIKQ